MTHQNYEFYSKKYDLHVKDVNFLNDQVLMIKTYINFCPIDGEFLHFKQEIDAKMGEILLSDIRNLFEKFGILIGSDICDGLGLSKIDNLIPILH